MNPIVLRQLWSIVESTQADIILTLDDADLVRLLLGQLEQRTSLIQDEYSKASSYLSGKTLLIRDLASWKKNLAAASE
jgi:hypothetical protein